MQVSSVLGCRMLAQGHNMLEIGQPNIKLKLVTCKLSGDDNGSSPQYERCLVNTPLQQVTWQRDRSLHSEDPLIPAGISNNIHYKMWDGIAYPFPNFNRAVVERWNGLVISYHTLQAMWLLIHSGVPWRCLRRDRHAYLVSHPYDSTSRFNQPFTSIIQQQVSKWERDCQWQIHPPWMLLCLVCFDLTEVASACLTPSGTNQDNEAVCCPLRHEFQFKFRFKMRTRSRSYFRDFFFLCVNFTRWYSIAWNWVLIRI